MSIITPQLIKKYDQHNLHGSILQLADQTADAWERSTTVRVPSSYRTVSSVLVCGMGGSAFPANMLRTVFESSLRVPFVVEEGYDLPGWIDRATLVVLSSYSGTTEETLSCARQAKRRGAKCLVLTTGGTLAVLARRWHWPAYVFDTVYNASNQPRMATGYTLTGMIGLLMRAGLLRVTRSDITSAVAMMRRLDVRFGVRRAHKKNEAKMLASALEKTIPIIISSEHLRGTAQGFRNQMNENAKHFSIQNDLPMLNHHLLEGFGHPRAAQSLHAVFFESGLYHSRNQVRYRVTKKVLDRYGIRWTSYRARSITRLQQAYETFSFGSYTGFYLSMLHHLDPAPIPWVDYFKAQLAKA